MPRLDRGSEHDETEPKAPEQLIDETRAERDAFRADPKNWATVDFTNRPDFIEKWGLENEPYTDEELERAKQYEAEEASVDYEAAGEVYTDDDGNLRPEYAWLVHEGPPPENPSPTTPDVHVAEADQSRDIRRHESNDRFPGTGPETTESREFAKNDDSAETSDSPEPTYTGLAEIAEGLKAGTLTPQDARQKLDDLPQGASDTTNELVRSDGELQCELGTPQEDANSVGELVRTEESDKISRRERQRREAYRAVGETGEDVRDYGNELQTISLTEPPEITGCYVGVEEPPRYAAPRPDGHAGDIALALVVSGIVAVKGLEKAHDAVRTVTDWAKEKDWPWQ